MPRRWRQIVVPGWGAGALAFAVVALHAAVECQAAGGAPQHAATAWSPFYAAMVNLSVVPAYKPPAKPAVPSAASRRAAGYPLEAASSRPPLQRDWKDPVGADGGLEGPARPPALPEVGRRRRRLQQQQQQQQQQHAPAAEAVPKDAGGTADGSGAATNAADDAEPAATAPAAATPAAAPCAAGAACFLPRGGFSGMDAPPAGTMGLAVGRRQAVQVAGGVMSVYSLGASGAKSALVKTVSLQKLFAAAAPGCEGVHDGAAAYDKHADRFVVTASCGGFGRLLVGATATPDAVGTWFMFGLIADAVNTPLECKAPKEQALADYPQIGYNQDGLFISYYSYCPSRPGVGGASLLALPKYKAYQGAPSMYYAVYTAAEVAAAAGLPSGPGAVRQLQPVAPQAASDVHEGVAYFVADHLPRPGARRTNFTLVALTNTGALWGYAAGLNGVPSPTLVATTVPWGRPVRIAPDGMLKQPDKGADLAAGGSTPAGFWSGGAALSTGKILITTRADVFDDSEAYTPRPGIAWAEVEPAVSWAPAAASFNSTAVAVAADECPAAVASGMAVQFDWSKDFSLTYGSEFAKNWSYSLNMFKAAQAIKPHVPKDATRAAAVVLDRAAALEEAAKTSPAANFQAMGFPRAGVTAAGGHSKGPMGAIGYRGRNNNCGCENSCGWGDLNTYNYVYYFDDYCDGGYNLWGPETGNDMFSTLYNGAYCTGDSSIGWVGNHQFDECWRWCLIRCPSRDGGVSTYTSPNYGFYGATNFYPGFFYASVREQGNEAPTAKPAERDPKPKGPTGPMKAAACASAASLGARLVRHGNVDVGAPLGLAFPAIAVAPNGAAVIGFTFSGPGKTADNMADAYPGVGAAFLDTKASGAIPMATLQRSAGPVLPVDTGGVLTWGELSAADVHPVTGAVYVAARRGGATRTGRSHVGTWIGLLPIALAR